MIQRESLIIQIGNVEIRRSSDEYILQIEGMSPIRHDSEKIRLNQWVVNKAIWNGFGHVSGLDFWTGDELPGRWFQLNVYSGRYVFVLTEETLGVLDSKRREFQGKSDFANLVRERLIWLHERVEWAILNCGHPGILIA